MTLDHRDPDDLRQAYEEADGKMTEAAERFDVRYRTVRKWMIDEGIHNPASQGGDEPHPDDPFPDATPRTDGTADVKAYVPAYQKEQWYEEAEELGMTKAAYLRTMVTRGVEAFGLGEDETKEEDGGTPLEDTVMELLDDDATEYETLVATVIDEWFGDDLEEQLDETLADLQANGQVTITRGQFTVAE